MDDEQTGPERPSERGAGPERPSEREVVKDGPPLLEVRGVTKRFEGLVAVEGVDLTVAEGEIVGVIGPNGAGKTTLFNCLSGLEVPTSGEILFRGRPLAGRPDRFTRAGQIPPLADLITARAPQLALGSSWAIP